MAVEIADRFFAAHARSPRSCSRDPALQVAGARCSAGCVALSLRRRVGKRPCPEPPIKRTLAAGEFREITGGCQRLGAGDRQTLAPAFFCAGGFPRCCALEKIDHSETGAAGADSAAMNALKPAGLIRMGIVSISTSSAARTAASRTKSVRERPRNVAARSMIAMSASGNRRVTTAVIARAQKQGLPVQPFTVHDLRRPSKPISCVSACKICELNHRKIDQPCSWREKSQVAWAILATLAMKAEGRSW